MKTYIFLIYILFLTQLIKAQNLICPELDNNKTYESLYKYMLDDMKKKKPDRIGFLEKDYEGVCIGFRNLKTDSILVDKNLIGVYSFRFVSTIDKPYLGLRHKDGKFEYIDMNLSFDKQIEKINIFLKKCCKEFSLEERIKTMYESVNVLYYYHFGVGCDEVIINYD